MLHGARADSATWHAAAPITAARGTVHTRSVFGRDLLSLLGAAHAQDEDLMTCEQCVAIQEGIHRTINHNISALETKAMSGTQTTERIEIGQLIWRMCDSES